MAIVRIPAHVREADGLQAFPGRQTFISGSGDSPRSTSPLRYLICRASLKFHSSLIRERSLSFWRAYLTVLGGSPVSFPISLWVSASPFKRRECTSNAEGGNFMISSFFFGVPCGGNGTGLLYTGTSIDMHKIFTRYHGFIARTRRFKMDYRSGARP
jgi:hypothetical protein